VWIVANDSGGKLGMIGDSVKEVDSDVKGPVVFLSPLMVGLLEDCRCVLSLDECVELLFSEHLISMVAEKESAHLKGVTGV
jgi:hypothetical protein